MNFLLSYLSFAAIIHFLSLEHLSKTQWFLKNYKDIYFEFPFSKDVLGFLGGSVVKKKNLPAI